MPLAPLQFHAVNAFAPTRHAGNQAAVVLFGFDDPRATDEAYLKAVARDFNLSETAYLVPHKVDGAEPTYGLRWFTPEAEVPLCGHATLASAYTLFNYVHPSATKLRFETRWSGALFATLDGERGQGSSVGLQLPISAAPTAQEHKEKYGALLAKAAGVSEEDIIGIGLYDFGGPSAVIHVRDTVDIGAIKFDVKAIMPDLGHAVVTNIYKEPNGEPYTLRANSRVFAPGVGIDEDPVTGSAWAMLTGFYLAVPGTGMDAAKALLPKGADLGKVTLDAHQLSLRGGALKARLAEQEGQAKLVGPGWRTGSGVLDVFED